MSTVPPPPGEPKRGPGAPGSTPVDATVGQPPSPQPTGPAPTLAAPPPAAPPPPPPAAPPPPPPAAPPPPPPPPGPSFDAAAQARTLFSQLDPSGYRPTAIVAGIILALFFGAQLLNGLIPVSAVGPGLPGPGGQGPAGPGPTIGPGPLTTALPPGSMLPVGPLRIPLENGWVPQDVPGSDIVMRLVKGGVAIDFFSASVSGDAATLYNGYMSTLQEGSTGFGATQPNLIQLGNGIAAARGSYTGLFGSTQVEGEITTIVLAGGQGWVLDVWTGSGMLGAQLAEADRMIDNLQVAQ